MTTEGRLPPLLDFSPAFTHAEAARAVAVGPLLLLLVLWLVAAEAAEAAALALASVGYAWTAGLISCARR